MNEVEIEELRSILYTMEVPGIRLFLNDDNCRWLLRNLGIKNREHKDFARAMILIKKQLGE